MKLVVVLFQLVLFQVVNPWLELFSSGIIPASPFATDLVLVF